MRKTERDQLYSAQITQLYSLAPIGFAATIVNVAVLAIVLWSITSHGVILAWGSAMLGITLLRYALLFHFRKAPTPLTHPSWWGKLFVGGIALSGLGWGGAGVLLFPIDSTFHQIFLTFILGGMVAGAAGTFSALKEAFIAFSVPAVTPIIARVLIIGDTLHIAMGAMIILFTLLMIMTSRHMHLMTAASLRLRYENMDLVHNLSDLNAHTEQMNHQLKAEIGERERKELFLTTQWQVTRILVDAPTLNHMAPRVLQTICTTLGWSLGTIWRVDSDTASLRNVAVWAESPEKVPELANACRQAIFQSNDGIPGRVWGSDDIEWIADVARDTSCARHAIAAREGLRGALAIPLRQHGMTCGVMEFFNPTIEEPDATLVRTLEGIGAQIGQYFERKKAEDAVRENAERFRSVASTAADAIILADVRGNIVFTNLSARATFGYADSELLGQPLTTLMPHRYRTRHTTAMERLCTTGKPALAGRTIELHGLRKNGEEFPLEVSLSPWTTLSGSYVTGILRDITNRKRVESDLVKTEQRFREIAENIHQVFWTRDATGSRVLYVSPAYEVIWGRSCTSLYSNPSDWISAIHPDDRQRVHSAFSQIPTGPKFDEEYRIIRPDGEIRWIHDSGYPVVHAQGNVARITGIAEDITERKHTEEALRHAHDDLEAKVAERTTQLEDANEALRIEIAERQDLEMQVRQSQKTEAIGQLAGGIAHDFNNILTGIFGFCDLATLHIPASSKAREDLGEVYRAAKRAAQLVDQILAFSRQSNNAPKPIKIGLIVEEALTLLRASIPSTIEIHHAIDPDEGVVLADPSQIHQVIMNLCTNSEHAMRGRTGTLTIQVANVTPHSRFCAEHRVDEGRYVCIRVTDTGYGMTPSTLERLYDPFFTTKPIGEGTGLGLSVIHGIVKQYQGALTVDSERGLGTDFKLYFPVTQQHLLQESSMDEPDYGGTERILFVDDEETITAVCKTTLTRLGYSVVTCNRSVEALHMFLNTPDRFDVVVTDEMMPQMTGRNLAQEILRARPDIPVILCTGFSYGATPEAIGAIGIRECVMKPMLAQDIAKAIRKHID